MKLSTVLISALILAGETSLVTARAGVDVGKGTDVIPPDSKEAVELHKSDNARKNAPMDKSYELSGNPDKFTKPELKNSNTKVDTNPDNIPDVEDISIPGTKDHPVVLNDYDPNNLGNSDDKDKEKDKSKDKEKEKDATSANTNANTVANANANSNAVEVDTDSEKNTEKDTKSEPSTPQQQQQQQSENSQDQSSDANTSTTTSSTNNQNADPAAAAISSSGGLSGNGLHSFTLSASMIIFSEIGDKTFLIAALMAMKHSRMVVFTAAFSSLVIMTILSALLGHALPTLLPKKLTSLMAAGLFVVFGAKLIREGFAMDKNLGVDEEMEEVEEEIQAKELAIKQDEEERYFGDHHKPQELRRVISEPKISDDGLEGDSGDYLYKSRPGRHSNNLKDSFKYIFEGVGNLASLVLSPIWVSVFVMTFLGEWGDRSQIATIAMAAGSDYWFVILGAICGHGLCTLAAVVGGKLLATKISMRNITIAGGFAFLVFAVFYCWEGLSTPW